MRFKPNPSISRHLIAPLASVALWFAGGSCDAQTPLGSITKVVTGNHTCALTTGGTVKCWGLNFFGQLGDNSTTNRYTPVDVISGPSLPALSGVSAITAGLNHTCVLIGGGVKCWGYNSNGQLGDGSTTQRLTPVDVVGLTAGVSAITTGALHTCALTNLGGVKCWGSNAAGRLGNNSVVLADSSTPVDVITLPSSAPLSGVVAIAAGGEHTCAIMSGGGMKCWGQNLQGQLGIDSLPLLGISRTPLDVLGLAAGVSAISLGGQHTCALSIGGGLRCWGYNDPGQLGDNSAINRLLPVDVFGLTSGVAAITAGNVHTCALTITGGAKCWGNGNIGQLGDNSQNGSRIPGDVLGLTSNVSDISAGRDHTCAVTSGGVKCWGFNGYGQLGDNTDIFRLTPVDVLLPSPIALSAVKSRKTHGAAGIFDLPLDTTQAIGASVTVESRGIGAGHQIVFQFSVPVITVGAATAVDSVGASIGIGSVTRSGHEVLVTLTNAADNSRAKISLNGTNGAVNSTASIGFLVGDANNSRSVNAIDLGSVKARSGQVTDLTNYRYDVNASGTVNVADILAVKARSGLALIP